jgi:hypothetical protein
MARRSKIKTIMLIPSAFAIFSIGWFIKSISSAHDKRKSDSAVLQMRNSAHFEMRAIDEQEIRQMTEEPGLRDGFGQMD